MAFLEFARRRRAVALVALAVLLGAFVAARPARADLTNPRQDFLRASTAGVFLHWGMLTSPGYTSCSAWENAITNGGWNAGYWVSEAQKLHASYLTLATFHSKLGYGRSWPSSIPGTCSTKRDFLGELITAAHAAGLRVILYMTNDAQWHDYNNHEWMDSAAYSAYQGHTVLLLLPVETASHVYQNAGRVAQAVNHGGLEEGRVDYFEQAATQHQQMANQVAAIHR